MSCPYLYLGFGAQVIHEMNEHNPKFTNTVTGEWSHSVEIWLGFLWDEVEKVSTQTAQLQM